MSNLKLIQSLCNLAIKICSKSRSHGIAKEELEKLKFLANSLRAADLNIDSSLLKNGRTYQPSSFPNSEAPVTYMKIFENHDVTICVFIVRNGAKIPLHDHPYMNGILKVLYGKVLVQRYNLTHNDYLHQNHTTKDSSIHPALKLPLLEVSEEDPACILTPSHANLHEIKSIGGAAAFLDILSPPYGFDKELGIHRDCHYYKEIDKNSLNEVNLVKIFEPPDFWCETVSYRGPEIFNEYN